MLIRHFNNEFTPKNHFYDIMLNMDILKNPYKIRYTAKIKADRPGIKIWFAQPTSHDFQKISDFSFSVPIKSKYQDKYKNSVLYFDLSKNKEVNLDIHFKIKNEFFRKDLNPKIIKIVPKNSVIYKTQTKTDQFLEQTKSAKKIAHLLSKNTKEPLEIVKNIFLYTKNTFKYQYPVKKRGMKNLDFERLCGDCGEYSAFFATLCRINKIPTKINTGFVVFSKNNSIHEHSWNSVYLKPYGWMDVDTQYGSLEKSDKIALKKYFCKRIENRIILTENYNISLKPSIPKNYDFSYWQKECLPMDRKNVQILQPLIFATKYKLKLFKQKFELIK